VNYKTARDKLVEYLNAQKPEGEGAELLDKCLQALGDCQEMGLDGKGE
jgi:hypothetical protein